MKTPIQRCLALAHIPSYFLPSGQPELVGLSNSWFKDAGILYEVLKVKKGSNKPLEDGLPHVVILSTVYYTVELT
jgi:hypothetical protein